jgi:hypothetical protein
VTRKSLPSLWYNSFLYSLLSAFIIHYLLSIIYFIVLALCALHSSSLVISVRSLVA